MFELQVGQRELASVDSCNHGIDLLLAELLLKHAPCCLLLTLTELLSAPDFNVVGDLGEGIDDLFCFVVAVKEIVFLTNTTQIVGAIGILQAIDEGKLR